MSSTALMRPGRSASRCAARSPIQPGLSSGPPVLAKARDMADLAAINIRHGEICALLGLQLTRNIRSHHALVTCSWRNNRGSARKPGRRADRADEIRQRIGARDNCGKRFSRPRRRQPRYQVEMGSYNDATALEIHRHRVNNGFGQCFCAELRRVCGRTSTLGPNLRNSEVSRRLASTCRLRRAAVTAAPAPSASNITKRRPRFAPNRRRMMRQKHRSIGLRGGRPSFASQDGGRFNARRPVQRKGAAKNGDDSGRAR